MIVTESRRRVLGRLVGFAALGAVAPIVIGCAGPGGGSANDAPGRLEIPDMAAIAIEAMVKKVSQNAE